MATFSAGLVIHTVAILRYYNEIRNLGYLVQRTESYCVLTLGTFNCESESAAVVTMLSPPGYNPVDIDK